MKQFDYHVEDGQFSFDFTAPLLGNVGDKIEIYDYWNDGQSNNVEVVREIEIFAIDFENECIECIVISGNKE